MSLKAKLLISERFVYEDGAIRQIVIWLVPRPIPPSTHSLKYRLAYAVKGERQIGYDNELGKGDHCHFNHSEFKYRFRGVGELLADFREAIQLARMLSSAQGALDPDQSSPVSAEGGEVIDLIYALREKLERNHGDDG